MSDKVNVLCLKWGKRYGADYVNRLYRGVSANLSRPFRFVCVTDDPSGLAAGVETAPFDEQPPGIQEVVAGHGEFAAYDHEFRVEQVDQAGRLLAEEDAD